MASTFLDADLGHRDTHTHTDTHRDNKPANITITKQFISLTLVHCQKNMDFLISSFVCVIYLYTDSKHGIMTVHGRFPETHRGMSCHIFRGMSVLVFVSFLRRTFQCIFRAYLYYTQWHTVQMMMKIGWKTNFSEICCFTFFFDKLYPLSLYTVYVIWLYWIRRWQQ